MATQSHGRSDWKSKAEEMAGQGAAAVADKGEDMATKAMEQAKNLGQNAMRSASDAATFVGDKAKAGTQAIGDTMENLGKKVRETGPHSGMLGTASSSMAEALESSGHYLKEHGLSGIGEDVTSLIRRNPIPAVLACVAFGYLIARASRS